MNKSTLKALSFSLVTLAASSFAMADDQNAIASAAAAPVESASIGCAASSAVELGWEWQQQRLEARLAEKSVNVPGTIITSPFDDVAVDKADAKTTAKSSKTNARGHRTASRSEN